MEKGEPIVAKQELNHRAKKVLLIFREFLCILFWVYTILKLFVFDLDVWLVEKFIPVAHGLLYLKFLFIVGAGLIFWLIAGDKNFIMSTIYLAFYPFIICFWRIPKLFFHNWPGAVLFLVALGDFVKSFKIKLFIYFFAFLSAVLIILNINSFISVISILILMAFLAYRYITEFKMAFSSASFFKQANKLYGDWIANRDNILLKDYLRLKIEAPHSPEYQTKSFSTLQVLLFTNYFMRFLGNKFKNFRKSKTIVFYFLSRLFVTLIITIWVFGCVYYALFNIIPESFTAALPFTLWQFYYSSFSILLGGSVGQFAPAHPIAQLIVVLEVFSRFVILTIPLSVWLGMYKDKHDSEIDLIIENLLKEASVLEDLIQREYQISLPEALAMVEKKEPAFTKVVVFFAEKSKDTTYEQN